MLQWWPSEHWSFGVLCPCVGSSRSWTPTAPCYGWGDRLGNVRVTMLVEPLVVFEALGHALVEDVAQP